MAGGEALSNRTSFREFFTRRLWDIAIVEVGLAGGLTECKKIIDLAETFGVECATHGFSSVAGTAAALHLAAVVPGPPSRGQTDCLPFEFAPPPFDRLADLMVEPFEVQDGTIQVPLARPGLGVELNREAVRRRLLK